MRPSLNPMSPKQLYNLKPYLNPEEPTLFQELYKEIIIRNPKKVGYSGLR